MSTGSKDSVEFYLFKRVAERIYGISPVKIRINFASKVIEPVAFFNALEEMTEDYSMQDDKLWFRKRISFFRKYQKIQYIYSLKDVQDFISKQFSDGFAFHPDTDFYDYVRINESGIQERTFELYNSFEADLKNEMLDQCFDFCEQNGYDIYKICVDIYQQEYFDLLHPIPNHL